MSWHYVFVVKPAEVDAFVDAIEQSTRFESSSTRRWPRTIVLDDDHALVVLPSRIDAESAKLVVADTTLLPGTDSRLMWYEDFMAGPLADLYKRAIKAKAERKEALGGLEESLKQMLESALDKKRGPVH